MTPRTRSTPPTTDPELKTPESIVRALYEAYVAQDRARAEALIADDFTFTSPYDDHISRAEYFERCWPTAGRISGFEVETVVAEGREAAFLTYRITTPDGRAFRNTEHQRVRDGQVVSVDVYFGAAERDGRFQSQAAGDTDAIRELLDRYTRAIHDKDAQAMIDCYAEDVETYDQAAPLAQGPALARDPAAIQAWFDTWEGPIASKSRDLRLRVSGDLGCAWTLQHLSGTKKDGGRGELWFRTTAALSKIRGAWKIVHLHNSVPFAMDGSEKALLDLHP